MSKDSHDRRSEWTLERKARRAERERQLAERTPPELYNVIYVDAPIIANIYNQSVLDAKDAVLFIWTTPEKTPDTLDVMSGWGFKYKSCCAWTPGQGHELLLVGTRGNIPAPAPGTQSDSVFRSPTKQPIIEMIDRLFPNCRRYNVL